MKGIQTWYIFLIIFVFYLTLEHLLSKKLLNAMFKG